MSLAGNLLNKALAVTEFWLVYVLAKIFGMSMAVRYLRNPNPRVTVRLLCAFGATIGEGTTFKRSVFVDNSYEDEHSAGDFRYIKIGKNCYIGDCVYFDLANEVVLDDNVVISGQVSFVTHADCNRSKYLEQLFPRRCQLIHVDEGAWIGFGATLLSGVTVGNHAVIAAHSLLRDDAEVKSLYGGAPAKKLKSLENR